jgi:hypothetical protein
LRGFPKPLPNGAGFALLLPLRGGRRGGAGFPLTLTWSSRIGGMDALLGLVVPHHDGGTWLIRHP